MTRLQATECDMLSSTILSYRLVYQTIYYSSPQDKRIHAMKALSCLAKFTGKYDDWLQLRLRYNLTWSTGNESLATLCRFFDDKKTLDTMLQWVREAIRILPADKGAAIKFNCLIGLRPNEALAAIRLISDRGIPVGLITTQSASVWNTLGYQRYFCEGPSLLTYQSLITNNYYKSPKKYENPYIRSPKIPMYAYWFELPHELVQENIRFLPKTIRVSHQKP